ncbi:MAG: S-methyl-5-thioribose-1-phosphate isomerase [Dehalococcoidales bacterium]|nr:S-methyl-5-thioribose-1-phosphate isomerase [Dehalococcoidales bacterium]MDP6738173.1 S-methyl-5-thioribose-1-phosphate isomerase [Dehalococcoidales bacterium]
MKNLNYRPIEWLGDRLKIIDQTKLPQEEVYLELNHYQDVASAIKELKVRGAPAIGVAGAYGIALGARKIQVRSKDNFLEKLQTVSQIIATTRPTARNLFYAVERMSRLISTKSDKSITEIKTALVEEAIKIHRDEIEATRKLSQFGSKLIKDGSTILTHCNAGPLATTGYGTALGVIIRAKEQGKKVKVVTPETRPLLQGARLTTWELKRARIPFTLITDSMAGYFMSHGGINSVIVGADRITANGDTANKIGTYTLAVLAKENGIPFYVAAPTTTIDLALASGKEISIEQRNPVEVTHIHGVSITHEGNEVANPAFDITPANYIAAIITELGIVKSPYEKRIGELCRGREQDNYKR